MFLTFEFANMVTLNIHSHYLLFNVLRDHLAYLFIVSVYDLWEIPLVTLTLPFIL